MSFFEHFVRQSASTDTKIDWCENCFETFLLQCLNAFVFEADCDSQLTFGNVSFLDIGGHDMVVWKHELWICLKQMHKQNQAMKQTIK